jgi:hypothetical protein
MNNDAIVSYCQYFKPHLIYIAIGCSQTFHDPGSDMASPQGYPPFLRTMGTRQLCILIDPLLEDPPRPCVPQEPGQQLIQVGSTHFIPVRRYFEWASKEDSAFIEALCAYTMENTRTRRMIVQDYSGAEIQRYYPLQQFGPELIRNVLFDFTYRDGGCFVDLSKVNIVFCEDSFSFLQPLYERLTYVIQRITPEQRSFILKSRHNIFYSYVKRLHKIQAGVEEPRDWCTRDIVLAAMAPFCQIYITPHCTTQDALEELLIAYLTDLCCATETQMTQEDLLACVRDPGNAYQTTLDILKGILLTQ